MQLTAISAASSWNITFPVLAVLILSFATYLRGWRRGRKLLKSDQDLRRLIAFSSGLIALFVAMQSPLDALDGTYLTAHMAQHFLLLMVAPPLLLLGHPFLPILRGLPKRFVKSALGPFLAWPALKHVAGWLVQPPVALFIFVLSTILWHLPRLYEVALSSSFWHGLQHASFFWTGILFWWPVVEPAPYRSKWPPWVGIPYLLFADLVNTALSAVFVFSGRFLYPTYEGIHGGSAAALDDQTVAGLIMWVPGSIIYLVPAFVLVMRVVSGASPHPRLAVRLPALQRADSTSTSGIRSLARRRWVLQLSMLLLAVAVMADGWFGPRLAPLNLAGVLPWIHWRALTVIGLLIVGNVFCMACPFTLVRDFGRRILRARRRWPKALRNKWLAAGLLLTYLWTYEAFGLWDKPSLTAWIIAGYFVAALVIDGIFRDASFCKYICPIGQFNFVTSLVSPREVAVKRASTCQSCRTYDCIRGNQHARGCELYLFQPKKVSNLDCTFCLECVNACPHDNVTLLSVSPGKSLIEDPYRSSIGRLSKRSDLAALTTIFVFGAFTNAAGMIGPVMTWEHQWHARLGPHGMPLAVGLFVAAATLLIPVLLTLLCWLLNRLLLPSFEARKFVHRLIFALVPLGVAMWSAHLLYHFGASWSSILVPLERLFSTGNRGLVVSVPSWITPAQILLLNVGLVSSLGIMWALAKQSASKAGEAVGLMGPWAAMATAMYVVGIWILFQPMQMRGVMS